MKNRFASALIAVAALCAFSTCAQACGPTYSNVTHAIDADNNDTVTEGYTRGTPYDDTAVTHWTVYGFESRTQFDIDDANIISVTYYPGYCGYEIYYSVDPVFISSFEFKPR